MSLDYAFLKTTSEWSAAELQRFRDSGYEAVNYQVQNGNSTKDYDFAATKAAGLRAEAWGVTYNASDFHADGILLGRQAVKLGAEGVTMNCEMAAKNTRASRGMKPIITGIREGGWQGPVNLNTLGAPSSPEVNDYEMDTDSFLETGGGVACQAYYNAFDDYRPDLCMSYWTRIGIPRNLINLTVGLYDPRSENPAKRQLSGAEYVPLLQNAGVRHGISIFRPETMLPHDLEELEVITLADIPPPEPEEDMEKIGNQHGIDAMTAVWRKQWPDKTNPNRKPDDLATWKAIDKLERTLGILARAHDEGE